MPRALNKMRSSLRRELFRALINQVPVLNYFERTIWETITGHYSGKKFVIQRQIDEVVSLLRNSPAYVDWSNPGAAESASFDVISILKRTEISPDLIIEMNFSEVELASHILENGEDVLTHASHLRRSLVEESIGKIAKILILAAVEDPEYKAKLYNKLLSR